MNENFELASIYGVDDDIDSCPQCSNTNLREDVLKTALSNIGVARNWYCGECKTAWIKGLRQPKFQH